LRTPLGLTALEAAVGYPLGGTARPTPRLAPAGDEPLAALTRAIERTLDNGSPAVAFSGGRDSSLLLAVAARICRRAGLEPPLPITLCAPEHLPEADERRWQELVVEHLQIPYWRRIPIQGELDLIGPYARRHLLRDGVLFPANAHSVVPMFEAAGRRCLLVGLGGDVLLSPPQWRSINDLLARRRRPEPRDLARLLACGVPRQVRGLARSISPQRLEELEWLRPAARSGLARSVKTGCEQPVWWRSAVRHLAACRHVVLPLRAQKRLAEVSGHELSAPLLDPGFVGALARAGGRCGWGSRTATMDALARDLLPSELVGRKTKAYFNRVFFGEESRAFAVAWSGGGLDERLVDPEALRREWLSDVPDFRTALLLQSAWLADRERGLAPAAQTTAGDREHGTAANRDHSQTTAAVREHELVGAP
jgi:asparagine synthase (glutamine-hydrolysing)